VSSITPTANESLTVSAEPRYQPSLSSGLEGLDSAPNCARTIFGQDALAPSSALLAQFALCHVDRPTVALATITRSQPLLLGHLKLLDENPLGNRIRHHLVPDAIGLRIPREPRDVANCGRRLHRLLESAGDDFIERNEPRHEDRIAEQIDVGGVAIDDIPKPVPVALVGEALCVAVRNIVRDSTVFDLVPIAIVPQRHIPICTFAPRRLLRSR
jgi:hypothetical protein